MFCLTLGPDISRHMANVTVLGKLGCGLLLCLFSTSNTELGAPVELTDVTVVCTHIAFCTLCCHPHWLHPTHYIPSFSFEPKFWLCREMIVYGVWWYVYIKMLYKCLFPCLSGDGKQSSSVAVFFHLLSLLLHFSPWYFYAFYPLLFFFLFSFFTWNYFLRLDVAVLTCLDLTWMLFSCQWDISYQDYLPQTWKRWVGGGAESERFLSVYWNLVGHGSVGWWDMGLPALFLTMSPCV